VEDVSIMGLLLILILIVFVIAAIVSRTYPEVERRLKEKRLEEDYFKRLAGK
jgi:Na+-transporting methylmalonyl-CoA/oxaloacetate decarboxylase gamma subunit